MHATDIVAYTYQAEILCAGCLGSRFNVPGIGPRQLEAYLDDLAAQESVDRMDERTFDSSDFPKVVFNSQVDGEERCYECGEEI